MGPPLYAKHRAKCLWFWAQGHRISFSERYWINKGPLLWLTYTQATVRAQRKRLTQPGGGGGLGWESQGTPKILIRWLWAGRQWLTTQNDSMVSRWILAYVQIWLMQSQCIPLPPPPQLFALPHHTLGENGVVGLISSSIIDSNLPLSKPAFMSEEHPPAIRTAGAVKQVYIYVAFSSPTK